MAYAAGRILIVDDDAALLKVMDIYLSRLGYRVEMCIRDRGRTRRFLEPLAGDSARLGD